MAALLALDLGSVTGFAYGAPGLCIHGEWKLKPSHHVSMASRAVELTRRIEKLAEAGGVSEVWYEAVEFASQGYAGQIYGALLSAVQGWCEVARVPYRGVNVRALKKFATRRGNASKDEMVLAAREFGYTIPPTEHNRADAICLLHYAASEMFK